jgi:hypothetical protein
LPLGRAECAIGLRVGLFAQTGITHLEMLHFTECTPTHMQVPGILKIGLGDRLQAALRVEPHGYFMRNGFVLDKAVFPGRLNSLFIKLLGVQFASCL